MREIKFRAWHKKHLRMFPISAIDFATNFAGCRTEKATINLCIQCKDKPCFAPYFHLTDLELMQYTGLKDKNGREIYEEDIIKFKDLHDAIVAEVKWWETGQWGYRPKGWITGYDAPSISGNVEVIGNIYENPELLKEK